MRSVRTREAFTLIEMLVVVAIIGMLAAMVLPAVQQAIESGRNAQCKANQHNVALAIKNYAESRNRYPGYVEKLNNKATDERWKKATWVVMIAPYLGRNDVWETWKNSNLPATPFIELVVCPSNFPDTERTQQLSYVVNCGREDKEKDDDKVENGLFMERYNGKKQVRPDIPDGVSQTMVLSENIQAKKWTVHEESVAAKQEAPDIYKVEQFIGAVWDGYDINRYYVESDEVSSVHEDWDFMDLDSNYKYARPSSYHGGGVNMAMADASVHFVRDSIEKGVLAKLMTPNGRESDNKNNEQREPLSDSDWK